MSVEKPCVFRLLIAFGARPQFVKLAALLQGFKHLEAVQRERIKLFLLNTGQHYDFGMAGVFMKDFQMPMMDFDLGVGSGSHASQMAAMMVGVEDACEQCRPSAILVFGDTNSTLAGALVGAKLHVPVIHIEAGLRSFDRRMPEEVNRILTDVVSSLLLCPCEEARNNLLRESAAGQIEVVGDLMIDIARATSANDHGGEVEIHRAGLEPGNYVLATIHRVENTDNPDRLASVAGAIESLSRRIPVAMPLHPRTRAAADRNGTVFRNIRILDPVGYPAMVRLVTHSRAVLTDSGGLKKEAHFFHKPCTTLRSSTEWTGTLKFGWNVLVNPDAAEIEQVVLREKPPEETWHPLYGNGDSGLRCWGQIAGHWQLS
jgi:UDP-N-acetylglucosamine 2-epimerase